VKKIAILGAYGFLGKPILSKLKTRGFEVVTFSHSEIDSSSNSNFIINLGGAKAEDVLDLIKLAQKEVKKVFNINLEPEVQFVGF
jgi:UDP-N-acetylenolpyruvoylglucosamine reductase